ncbi:MAG: Xaa-Pro peptidase family protein, partial [Bacillota bacterium]
ADQYITGGPDYQDCKSALEPLGFQVTACDHGQEASAAVARVAEALQLRRVGVEAGQITVRGFRELRERVGAVGVELVAAEDVVDPLREVKDPWEIEQITRACEVSRAAFEATIGIVQPGITEWELAAELECQLRRRGYGSSRIAFQSVVVSGPRSCLPHGSVTTRKLRGGDLVTCDFGATWNGYCADVTRTFVLGEASGKQRAVYSAVLDAQAAAVQLMQPGADRSEASRRGASIIEERGFGQYMAHGAGGHGIGLEVHEGPSTRSGGTWEAGNVVTIEPGIYIPGWGGVRIEDDVVITPAGPGVITSIPRGLLEI